MTIPRCSRCGCALALVIKWGGGRYWYCPLCVTLPPQQFDGQVEP